MMYVCVCLMGQDQRSYDAAGEGNLTEVPSTRAPM